jgi:hypothetical protein
MNGNFKLCAGVFTGFMFALNKTKQLHGGACRLETAG